MTMLRAPFPYFGGKRMVAARIWERLGNTPNYSDLLQSALPTAPHNAAPTDGSVMQGGADDAG